MNQCSFKLSSRNFPLKLSMYAFSFGLPVGCVSARQRLPFEHTDALASASPYGEAGFPVEPIDAFTRR